MSKWVSKALEELLIEINEVPFTDDRERTQLSILMKGFMEINNQAMGSAAARVKQQLNQLESPNANETQADMPEIDLEFTRLKPLK